MFHDRELVWKRTKMPMMITIQLSLEEVDSADHNHKRGGDEAYA